MYLPTAQKSYIFNVVLVRRKQFLGQRFPSDPLSRILAVHSIILNMSPQQKHQILNQLGIEG